MAIAGMTLTDAALHYAGLGYPVFPLAPRSKKPMSGSNGLLGATTDEDAVAELWKREQSSNIGIRTDGLIVVDPDLIGKEGPNPQPNPWLTEERARSMAIAPTQRTWSGGRQYIFRQPEGRHYRNTDGELAPHVDTRGYGGYIVAPPSFVRNGKKSGYYEFATGCELEVEPDFLPEPPSWLVAELDRIEVNRGKAKPSNGDGHKANGDTIPEGKRDGTLASMAGTMRRRGMTASAIEAALAAENEARCNPPLPEADIKRIANSVSRYEPGASMNGHESAPIATPRLVNLGTVQAKSVRWLWPNRIALGKLTTIAGEPGLGKSLWSLDAIARVTTGNPWPDDTEGFNQAGSAVLLSAEDDIEDTIAPRLKSAGADLNFVTAIQGVEFKIDDAPAKLRCFNLERDLPALEQAINAQPDCRLVVIDPISAYLGETDSHKNAELRGLLAPLAELAARRQVAVVTITHLNKTSGAKALHRVTGSLAFVAAARAAWLVTPDKEKPKRRLFLPIKNNLAPDNGGLAFGIADGPALAWEEGTVTTSADDALAADDNRKEKPRRQEKAWLTDRLSNGPVRQDDIRSELKAAGFSWSTIRRAADDLDVKAFKSSFSGGWMWRLQPEDAHDPGDTGQVSALGASPYEETDF